MATCPFALLLMVSCFSAAAAAQDQKPELVSLAQLKAGPEKYEGKLIQVSGYLWLNPGTAGDRLFFHEQDYQQSLVQNSLRLERTALTPEEKLELNGNYIRMIAVFHSPGRGSADGGVGSLRYVKSCKLLFRSTATTSPSEEGGASDGGDVEANEAWAVASLRTINLACVTYANTYGTGFPAALSDLGPSRTPSPSRQSANLIGGVLSGGTKNGYVFSFASGEAANGVVPSYTVTADPVTPGQTGRRHFFTDQSGVVRSSDSAAASASDPPIRESSYAPAFASAAEIVEANEASAVNSLRRINVACVTYSITYGTGYPVALSDLGPSSTPSAQSASLIDGVLARGTKDGYVFTFVSGAAANGVVPTYTVTAEPLRPGQTGRRHFFTDQSGVVRSNDESTATALDPPIE